MSENRRELHGLFALDNAIVRIAAICGAMFLGAMGRRRRRRRWLVRIAPGLPSVRLVSVTLMAGFEFVICPTVKGSLLPVRSSNATSRVCSMPCFSLPKMINSHALKGLGGL